MSKLILLRFGEGDLNHGFELWLQLRNQKDQNLEKETQASLPPNPELIEDYEHWSKNFPTPTLKDRKTYKEKIANNLNQWLSCPEFFTNFSSLTGKCNDNEEIHLILQTENPDLQKIPWCTWTFFDRYPKAEIAIASTATENISLPKIANPSVKILTILGNSQGLHWVKKDKQELEKLPNIAPLNPLVEPNKQDIGVELWEQNWDILFFAGHSDTKEDTGRIYINSKEKEEENSLALKELKFGLKRSIRNGLRIAIFNSCRGLGLARDLADLNIPVVIVMREKVPDLIAPEFLKHFLQSYAGGDSLYLSVRQAREKLEDLRGKEVPCASWLPVIYQNTSASPPLWKDLYQPKTASLRSIITASLVATALVLGIRQIGLLQPLELKTFDFFLASRPVAQKLDDRLLIVEVTEEELEGQNAEIPYSISDLTLAKILQTLQQNNPKVIGLDIFRDIPLGEGYAELTQQLQKKEIPIIGICSVYPGQNSASIPPPPTLPIYQVGFVDILKDPDGLTRRQLLALNPERIEDSQCQSKRSLALLVSLSYLRKKMGYEIEKTGDLLIGYRKFPRLQSNLGGYHDLDTQGYQILFDPINSQQIAPILSISDLLSGDFNELIQGRIVLIGVTAESVGDYFSIASHSQISGVELHAQMVSQILNAVENKRFLLKPLPKWGDILWITVWGFSSGLLIWKLKNQQWQTAIVLIAIAIPVIGYLSLLGAGLWLPVIPPLLVISILPGLVIIMGQLKWE